MVPEPLLRHTEGINNHTRKTDFSQSSDNMA